MQSHALVAIVTVLALLLYFVMSLRVAGARTRYKIPAPAISGNEDFERIFRVQANTLEWLPIFLPALWMYAVLGHGMILNDRVAAAAGVVWIIGRFLYMTGYSKAAGARSLGFGIQSLATAWLLFGSLIAAVLQIMAAGHI
jgi:glutathione S-transferase